MDVHIDLRGIDGDIHHRDRMASGQQQRVIRLLDGGVEHAAEHPAMIDEEGHMLACALKAAGQTSVTAHHRPFGIVVVAVQAANRHHLLRHLQPINLHQHARQLTVAGRSEDLATLAGHAESNLRIGQRILLQQVQAVADLRVAALQELQAGRHRAEEIAHRQRRPDGRSGGSHIRQRAVLRANLRPLVRVAVPAEQGHIRHGCDTGQGLAAKAQRANMLQIVDLRHLARRVARQGQGQLICGNTRAIIRHADQLQAAIHQLHANLRCAGIDAILNQLLHDRGRALNHLAGGNLSGDIGRELANGHDRHSSTSALLSL